MTGAAALSRDYSSFYGVRIRTFSVPVSTIDRVGPQRPAPASMMNRASPWGEKRLHPQLIGASRGPADAPAIPVKPDVMLPNPGHASPRS